jgi:hypothetical protein
LRDSLDEMDLEDTARQRYEEFYYNKTKFMQGELKSSDFENLRTLGVGSGGVVWKSRHIPSGIILARKVTKFWFRGRGRVFIFYFIFSKLMIFRGKKI